MIEWKETWNGGSGERDLTDLAEDVRVPGRFALS